MKEEKRHLSKVLSILLRYPEEEFVRQIAELREAVEGISAFEAHEKCAEFLSYLKETPLIRLQEEYTSTFDLSATTCLNLTYHKWGDSRDRGSALVDFHSLYHSAGYECVSRELPDYLPLVLEFLSINRKESQFSLLGEYCDQAKTIRSRLQETGSPYAGLLEIVVDVFREVKARGA